MATLQAFQPQGNTVLVAASSSTASTATQWSTNNGIFGVRCVSGSTIPVYCAFGSSLVQAAAPTTTLPCVGTPIMPNQPTAIFSITSNPTYSWVSAATTAGSALLFVTPGFGQ